MRRRRRRWRRGRGSGGGDCGGAGDLQEREAAAGGAGGGGRRDVIDDFAHHPTAIRETLRALRSAIRGAGLWAVLEPRSNTLRRNVFEQELVESLALADEVVLAAVFKSEAIPAAERLEPEHVIAALRRGRACGVVRGCGCDCGGDCAADAGGDVVAILSNGGFGGIYEKLPCVESGSAGVVAVDSGDDERVPEAVADEDSSAGNGDAHGEVCAGGSWAQPRGGGEERGGGRCGVALRSGLHITIFPGGHAVAGWKTAALQAGSLLSGEATGAPMIPVSFTAGHGADDAQG
jgi:hypothetical protein